MILSEIDGTRRARLLWNVRLGNETVIIVIVDHHPSAARGVAVRAPPRLNFPNDYDLFLWRAAAGFLYEDRISDIKPELVTIILLYVTISYNTYYNATYRQFYFIRFFYIIYIMYIFIFLPAMQFGEHMTESIKYDRTEYCNVQCLRILLFAYILYARVQSRELFLHFLLRTILTTAYNTHRYTNIMRAFTT